MVTKLILRPPSFSSILLSRNRIFTNASLFKFHVLSLFSTNNPSQTLSYGPSLLKGTKRVESNQFQYLNNQLIEDEGGEIDAIDEESFTRVFDVAALRVPSEDCFALENRLRGHLLNWPRIRNIARVPGDEVDEEFVALLGERRSDLGEEDGVVSLDRRMYGKSDGDGELLSPVLYREKLVKTFDSRGFVNFRNLAKMSRPDKKKIKSSDGGKGGVSGEKKIGKNEFSVVEVVEDYLEGEDFSGLLGKEFKGRKWKGSTRLLLLDEQYASKGVEDLPEAIKVYLPTI